METSEQNKLQLSEEALQTEDFDAESFQEEEEINVVQLVGFSLDDVEYGVAILDVFEILKTYKMSRLPNSPEYIKGVINLRGEVVPVIDIRTRFGLNQVKATELSRIIVVNNNGKKIGLFVDNVRKVIRVPEANVSPPSELMTGISGEFIFGIGRLSERLIIIIKMDNIIEL